MNKRTLAVLVFAAFFSDFGGDGADRHLVVEAAQEKITLAVPVFTDAGATEFRLSSLYLNRQGEEIRAIFAEVQAGTVTFVPNGRTLACRYDGDTAVTILAALNKANLSIQSLERRVTSRCQTDGKLGAGVISGVPE